MTTRLQSGTRGLAASEGQRSPCHIVKQFAPLCLFLVMLGCNYSQYAGYTRRAGDLTPFALGYILDCGGHPKTTNGLPAIQASWKFKADKNGVQIYADGDHFKAIQELLIKQFGEPDPS